MKVGNKTTAYKYNKNDELLRTDTLNSETEKNEVVICKNDKMEISWLPSTGMRFQVAQMMKTTSMWM